MQVTTSSPLAQATEQMALAGHARGEGQASAAHLIHENLGFPAPITDQGGCQAFNWL
jgi:hypothetical protein